jgi:hypothetical protein
MTIGGFAGNDDPNPDINQAGGDREPGVARHVGGFGPQGANQQRRLRHNRVSAEAMN